MLHAGVLCLVALITIFLTHWFCRWRNPKCKNGILPPGSMGIPVIGETLELLIPGRSFDINPFIKKRLKKYGPIFKTSLVGKSVVFSSDPEVNHYLLQQEGKSIELWYLESFSKLFHTDESGKLEAYTAPHKYIRNVVMKHFGLQSLKEKMLPEIEILIYKTLSAWFEMDTVDVKNATEKMVFNFTSKHMFDYDAEIDKDNLNGKVSNLVSGLLSLPLNIPGTAFHECLKKKDCVVSAVKKKLREKINNPEANQEDLLGQIVKDMKTEKFITENFASNLIFAVLFAGLEAISLIVTVAFLLLSEYPSVVDELRAEHENIIGKKMPGEQLTWEEYKSMTFTLQVINEVQRMASMVLAFFRRTTKDVQVNGYTIPKGWTVLVGISAQQLNPNIYKDPLIFNPHRWEDLDPDVISKNFMPFGAGMRQCAGAELSKVFMSIFFHVLCTKYSWTKVKGGNNIRRKPFLDLGEPIIIKVSKSE